MTAFLASVRSLEEAKLVHAAGADWIDIKDPDNGALGAASPDTVAAISHWAKSCVAINSLSATIGDCWGNLDEIPPRVAALRALEIPFVKIGLYAAAPSPHMLQTIRSCVAAGVSIIVVCFAESLPSSDDVKAFANTGVAGMMLDTAEKENGCLTDLLSAAELAKFVQTVRAQDMLCGLAGSLRCEHLATLVPLGADYLGFRGGLCAQHTRTKAVCRDAVQRVRRTMDRIAETSAGVTVTTA